MRRSLRLVLALALFAPATPWPVGAAEDKLVIYTAYEENELKTFWEQFTKDRPDLAAKAAYIRGSTGPTMARVEDKMWQYYETRDRNLSQVTKSGGAPGRMAASGETPIGIALAYEVEVAKKQGAPIDVIYPTDGVAWTFEGNALVKGAKNPQNGRRFLDWAMSRSAMDAYVKWRGSGI